LPLSRLKGVVVDAFPLSFVEATVWTGLLCLATLGFCAASGRWQAFRKRRRLFRAVIAGPVVLLLLSLGQGAFPLSLAPSAWRKTLARHVEPPPLPYGEFQAEVRRRENRLHSRFGPAYYGTLPETEILAGCDTALDRVLERLGMPPGRAVRRVKAMGPLTTLLGLSYGGPAFHDPFFGELAIVKTVDHPTPRYWRLLAVCHEAAHAKGFTREMDAEILTQLALSSSHDPRYVLLGDIMFLRKSGEGVRLPEALRREIRASRDSLAATERRQPAVRFLRSLSKRLGFQNSGGKYGTREAREAWDSAHPFFATVVDQVPRMGGADAP
jgi:hypothetical protein